MKCGLDISPSFEQELALIDECDKIEAQCNPFSCIEVQRCLTSLLPNFAMQCSAIDASQDIRTTTTAECKLSVLARQCLKRRLGDMQTLRRETVAWERERNAAQKDVDWRFTTEDQA